MVISTSTYWIKVILELYRSKEKYVVYLVSLIANKIGNWSVTVCPIASNFKVR